MTESGTDTRKCARKTARKQASQLTIRLSRDLHTALKVAAVRNGETLQGFVARHLQNVVEVNP